MLCLNEDAISRAASYDEFIKAVENALLLYEKKEFHMPLRMHCEYQGNTLLLMPSFTSERFAVKLVSLFPANAQQNIPVLMGTVILNDGRTGKPLALMNGAKLTALRTGAVGGAAVRHLTPNTIRTLGIVGAGVQGFHQALFACQVRPISQVSVYDSESTRLPGFIERLAAALPGVNIIPADSSKTLLEKSELIITATNATLPVLPDDVELLRGKYYIGIGSYRPGMREFPPSLFQLVDNLYVDTEHAIEESGDVIEPLKNNWLTREQVKTLGSHLILNTGKNKEAAPAGDRAIIFKSVGMSLFDLLAADLVYRNALAKGLGTTVEL